MLQVDSRGPTSTELPYAVFNGIAWYIAAELIRRNPQSLRVIETHPGGGQYDCISVLTRTADPQRVVDMNRVGSLHTGMQIDGRDRWGSFDWLQVLQLDDIRENLIRPIEARLGIASPNKSPPTTQQSIGVRVLARLAGCQVVDLHRILIR
jgi:hypothetical protein